MDRDRITTHRVDPEAEDLRILNHKVQDRREKQAAQRKRVQRCIQRAAANAMANERRLQELEKEYQLYTDKLVDRILVFLCFCFGAYLFWKDGVMYREALTLIILVCSCVISFSAGVLREKRDQLGGEKA